MPMKIDFYIPTDQEIPTRLRLKVDDKYDVYYHEDPSEFAWHFTFWNEAQDHYKEILDEIVARMKMQSYDHGACWRETGREVTHYPVEFWDELTVKVSFRLRDAG